MVQANTDCLLALFEERERSNLLANFPLTDPVTACSETLGQTAASLTDAVGDQLLRLPGELTGDGRQGGDVDGHDVGGVTGVLPRPAGSVHRLPVTLPVTGAVTAGEAGDPCSSAVRSVIAQISNSQIQNPTSWRHHRLVCSCSDQTAVS